MNVNQKLLALMVALAAGSALGAGTTAGTVINNQASATFTDPATNAPVTAPVVSNTVSTTVLPIPALDIVYKGPAGTTTDNAGVTTPTTNNDGTSAGNANTNFKKSGVLPGSNVDTTYVVLNNGNVDNYLVTLNNTPLNNPSGVVVQYFLASDTAFTTPITTVTVPASGSVDIVQRIKIPAAAAVGTVISVSPYGTSAAGTSSGNAYAAVDETQNVNVPPTPAANKDLEFTDATVFAPTVTTAPTPPVDPANPVVPTTPTTNIGTPPTANAANPLNPVSPPGTPSDPSDPVKPGYADPLNPGTAAVPGTPIVVSGNSQIAYPPADANNTPDVVTFKNVVSTPVLAGTPADTISLFPTDATGLPIGTNNGNGTFTLPDGVTVVKFLKPDGTPLPTAVNPADGKIYPVVSTPAGGGTTPYLTQVVYPDSNPNNNTSTIDNPVPIVITVGADSGNDADLKANGITTDTIYPAAAQFGDVPASGSTPDRTLVGPGNVSQVVVPGAPAAIGAPATGTATDSTAVFPMLLSNTGEYGDTYTLSGTVPVKLSDGTTVNVPVRYVDAAGVALPSGAGANTFISPYVGPNSTGTVFAVIDIPAGAAATNGVPLIVTQTAVGNFSTVILTDINDQIVIGTIGGAVPTKTVDKPSAKPGEDLTYTITAKNSYNTLVKNYVLKEADGPVTNVFANSVFKSVNVAVTGATGTVLYRFNGGAWQTSNVPTIALNTVTSVEVGLNTNADTVIDSNDTLPVNGQLVETLVVTVK